MSDLSDHVEKLVLDALAEALPGPVTGFVGMANYLREDGEQGWCFFDMPDQRLGTSLGIARSVSLFYEEQFRQYFQDADDD